MAAVVEKKNYVHCGGWGREWGGGEGGGGFLKKRTKTNNGGWSSLSARSLCEKNFLLVAKSFAVLSLIQHIKLFFY